MTQHSSFVSLSPTRAAQKLNITSRKKKKHHPAEPEPPPFPTNFGGVIQLNPPPAPPCLLRPNTRLQNPVLCKVSYCPHQPPCPLPPAPCPSVPLPPGGRSGSVIMWSVFCPYDVSTIIPMFCSCLIVCRSQSNMSAD